MTSTGNQAANALLSGALVFHSFSAVIAFVGAFILVRYKLSEAKKEEAKEEGKPPHEKKDSDQSKSYNYQPFCADPHIERVGGFMGKRPPNELLTRTHTIAILTAFIGFLFGIAGIICFAWTQQTHAVGIFSSVCIAVCVFGSIFVLAPLARASKQTDT